MEHFGTPHLLAIAATLLVAIGAAVLPRVAPRRLGSRQLGAALAVALAIVWAAMLVDRIRPFDAATDLPLHLSDWAVAASIIALVSRAPLAVELTWFWALAGASWAVLTPDLARDFSSATTWGFFVLHGGVIATALWLVVGDRVYLEQGAAARAALATAAVALVAGVADLATGGNYMYLREPPPRGSLLDLAGPWPWYLPVAAALAVVLLWLLERPVRARP